MHTTRRARVSKHRVVHKTLGAKMELTEAEYAELDALRELGWVAATAAQAKRRRELLDMEDS